MTMGAIVADIGTVVTGAFTWASAAVSFITANPLILLMFVIPLVGLGIGFVKRLVN